ncbi:MAG: hypothetical protein LUO97_07550, partial [Methanomicrobiales archaeon]|nr:hypothetical protein [Methanomicrobiales archaeon]
GFSVEVVLVGDPGAEDTRRLLSVIDSRDLPGMTVLLKRPGGDPLLDDLAPFTREFADRDGGATAYVCRNHACELPVTDPDTLRALLGPWTPGGPEGHG